MSELDKFLSEVEDYGPYADESKNKLIAIVKYQREAIEDAEMSPRILNEKNLIENMQILLRSAIAKSNAIAKGKL